jgi:two-component system, OmpR family, KDP operon response regulator KdpE
VIDATTAIATFSSSKPDALVLDLRLPDRNGFALIKHIRKIALTPIVVLSARDNVTTKIKVLELGADANVTKPFNMDEFLARLKAALRHGLQAVGVIPVYRTGPLIADLVRRIVFLHGKEIHLSPKEFGWS